MKQYSNKRSGIFFTAKGFLFLCIFFISFNNGYAGLVTSAGSGNWSTLAWTPAAPIAGDSVVIAATHTVTINAATVNLLALTIDGTVNWTVVNTVTVNSGGGVHLRTGGNITGTVAGVITTSGNLTVNATATSTTAGVTMTGVSKTITGTGSIGVLNINAGASATSSGTLTVTTTLGGGATGTLTNTGTLNIGAATVTPAITASAVGNTVNYNRAGNQTTRAATYHHLTISGSGTKTLGGITTVNGDLNISAGTLSLSTFNFTVSGTTTIAGILSDANATGTDIFVGLLSTTAAGRCTTNTVTASAGVEFRGGITHANATANTFLAGGCTFTTNAQSLGGAGTINFANGVIANVAMSNNGIVTMSNTGAATLSGSGSWTNNNGSTLNYAGSTLTIGTYSFSTSTNTVNYTSTIAQTVYGTTYHHLTCSGAGAKTLSGNATINGNFTLSAGSLELGANNFAVTGTSNVTGTLTDGNDTGSDLFVGAVTINAAGRCTTNTVTTSANLEFRGGISFANATANTFLGGGVTFSTNAQALSGAGTLNFANNVIANVTITNNTRVTISNTAAGALSGSGTWNQANGSTLTYSGSTITISAYSFSTATNMVNYASASAQTVYGVAYNNLGISGGGTKTLAGNATASGTLNITAGVLDLGTVATTFSVTGVSTIAGTLSFNGTSTKTVTLTGNLTGTGGTIDMSGGSLLHTLNLGGATNSLTTLTTAAVASTINYNRNGVQTIFGSPNYRNLTTSVGNVVKTLAGDVTVNDNLTISIGTLELSTFNFTVSGTSSVSGTLSDGNDTGSDLFTGLVTVNAAGRCTTNTVTTSANLEFRGGITHSNATANTFLAGGCTFTTNPQSLGGAGTLNFAGVVVANVAITNNGTVSMSSTSAGALQGSGSWLNSNGTSLNFSGASMTISATNFSTNTNTVTYNSGSAQAVFAGTYHHLISSGAGTKTLSNDATVNGNLTISAGTFDMGTTATTFSVTGTSAIAGTLSFNGTTTKTVTLTGNLSGAGTIDMSGGSLLHTLNLGGSTNSITTLTTAAVASTINYNANGAQTIFSSANYRNLTISGSSGTKTLGGNITVNNDLTFSQPLDVSVSNYAIDLKGNWVNNSTFTPQSGTVTFSGTASGQSIGGTTTNNTFYNMTVTNTNATGVYLAADQNLNNVLTLGANSKFTTTGYNFVLLSSATNTASIAAVPATASFVGNITMQRYTPGGSTGWACIGTAVNNTKITDWQDNFATSGFTGATASANGNVSIYTYNEPTLGVVDNGYTAATNATNDVLPGQGFFVYLGDNATSVSSFTIDVTNSPIIGDVVMPVSYTDDPSQPATEDGWNLIANPYPCPISWTTTLSQATTPANVDGTIYVWNADLNGGTGGYATYNGLVSSPAVGSGGIGNTIPINQAFFVHLTGATTWTVTENAKTTGNPTFLKQNQNKIQDPIPNIFRLSVKGQNKYLDEMVVCLHSNATDDFDKSFDAYKLYNGVPESPSICSVLNGTEYTINSINEFVTEKIIPVKVKVGISGNYTLFTDSLKEFNTTSCVYLEDKLTGATINLKDVYSYTCYISDTTNAPRFFIRISNAVAVSYQDASCANISDGKIIMKGAPTVLWNYDLNQVGKNKHFSKQNVSLADSVLSLEPGTYVVTISGNDICSVFNDTITISSPIATVASFVADIDSVDVNDPRWVIFTNTSTQAQHYSWNLSNNSTMVFDEHTQYFYDQIGSYNVQLIATGTCMSDTANKTIVVYDSKMVGVNKNTLSKTTMQPLLIDQEIVLKYSFDNYQNINIKLISMNGNIVYDRTLNNIIQGEEKFSTFDISKGIYILRIISDGESAYEQKMFIQ